MPIGCLATSNKPLSGAHTAAEAEDDALGYILCHKLGKDKYMIHDLGPKRHVKLILTKHVRYGLQFKSQKSPILMKRSPIKHV